MNSLADRIYPLAAAVILLHIVNARWPGAIDVGTVIEYDKPLGAQIIDLVAMIMEPMDFTR